MTEKRIKKIVDLVESQSLDELSEDLAFSASIFMVFGLPTRKLKDHPESWIKENKFYKLSIQRSPDKKRNIPYGCYSRMNQIFIDTEVKKKNTNVIQLGKSFSEYVENLGYSRGKANQAILSRLVDYVSSRIIVEPKREIGRISGIQTGVGRAWDIYFDYSNPSQLMLQEGKIILDEEYAKYIYNHAVPIDMNIIRVFKNNATALDFIRFLAYRNNNLNKEISFPEENLFDHLGTQTEHKYLLRTRLKKVLKMLKVYWPVQASFQDGYFCLKPSPPAIEKKKLR